MYGRARSVIFALSLAVIPCEAAAQAVWQPTPPPLVTAENETWYRTGAPIEWNGDFYYPAGAPRAFDRYAMARGGSYRGIPLYTDTTLEPYSIVFVPIAGGRVQPYERPRTGMLASTTGSQAPSFPPETAAALSLTSGGFVREAPMPPTVARPYDLAPTAPPATIQSTPSIGQPVGTSGRTIIMSSSRTAVTALRPKGLNGVWIEYGGRRWVASGRAEKLSPDLQPIGTYRGFTVYGRGNDRSTIYVPSGNDLVVPYRQR
jgi:hypothetical protein